MVRLPRPLLWMLGVRGRLVHESFSRPLRLWERAFRWTTEALLDLWEWPQHRRAMRQLRAIHKRAEKAIAECEALRRELGL